MASPLMAIPDHLQAEIFLRLPAAEDLARASAACVSFRRLVTEKPFLRRFRRLHAPPLLGLHDQYGFHPAVPPHPSAPAARVLSLAADFTFSFLPSRRRWTVRDVRDGRVLLDHDLEVDVQLPYFTELVVCDPLHRRYVLLPPLPDDLAASVEDPGHSFCEPSLIPPSEEEGAAEETAFRVIWLVCCKIKVYIFVFSSSAGRWRAAASQGLRDLLLAKDESTMVTLQYVMWRHYAGGCVYWVLMTDNDIRNESLVLDTWSMELSIADHPHKEWSVGGLGIVEAGGDELWMFRIIIDETAEDDIRYIIGGNRGLSSAKWQVEKSVSLDSAYRYWILAATGRYLLLERRGFGVNLCYRECFSLDIETLQLEMLWGKRRPVWPGTQMPYIYTNFPPSLLSSPTVCSGKLLLHPSFSLNSPIAYW